MSREEGRKGQSVSSLLAGGGPAGESLQMALGRESAWAGQRLRAGQGRGR